MSKPFRVRQGLASVTIHSTAKGWRFEIAGEKRRYVTRKKRQDIEAEARRYLSTQDETARRWDTIPPERRDFLLGVLGLVPVADEADVLAYLSQRNASATIAQACERFYESMALRGRSERHVKALMMDLDAFAAHCPGTVSDVTTEALRAFVDHRCGNAGLSRRKMIRATLVQFFRWCRKEALIPNEAITVADRLTAVTLPTGGKHVLTRQELEACMDVVPDKHRAWFALGAWAGLRPEEAAPTKTKLADGKRGVAWEDIDWDFNLIRIAAETSKVDRPRIVPLYEALRDVLWPLRGTGAICQTSPVHDKTLRKVAQRALGGAWPADCLRHSYASYRNALIRNLPQIAEEMSTSLNMLHRHYHNPRAKEEGEIWFTPSKELQKVMQKLCKKEAPIPYHCASAAKIC